MLSYFLEHLLDNYQGERKFILNKNEVKFRLKDVVLISRLRVAPTYFELTEVQKPSKDRFCPEIKKLATRKTIRPIFIVDSEK